ncbi:MAG: hypothetical protein ACU841_13135 [Gammaproteobacteria bacterium]
MKRYFIPALLLLAASLAESASLERITADAPQHRSKLERLSEKLGLTDEQKHRIDQLYHANKDKLKALKEDNREPLKATPTPEQKHKLKVRLNHRKLLEELEKENHPDTPNPE